MATIKVLNDPALDASYGYVFNLSQWKFSKAVITKSSDLSIWQDSVEYEDNTNHYPAVIATAESIPVGQSRTYTNALTVRFPDGIQSLTDGELYDIEIKLTKIYVKNDQTDASRHCAVFSWNDWNAVFDAYSFTDSRKKFTGGCTLDVEYTISRIGGPDGAMPISCADIDQPDEYFIIPAGNNIQNIYVKTGSWLTWNGKTINTDVVNSEQSISFPNTFRGRRDDEDHTSIFMMQLSASGNYQWHGEWCGTAVSGAQIPTYTITYNSVGGTAISSQVKAHSKSVKLTTKRPTKNSSSDTEFLGWSESEGSTVKYQPGDVYTVDANITLYALWRYRVRYEGSNGTIYDSNGSSKTSPYDIWKVHNSDISILCVFYPSDASKDWYEWSGNNNIKYKFEDVYTTNAPLVLTANTTTIQCTVRFFTDSSKSDNPPLKTATVNRGSAVTPPTTPTKAGKTFVGWSVSTANVESDMDVYGIWEIGYVWYMTRNGWVIYSPKE